MFLISVSVQSGEGAVAARLPLHALEGGVSYSSARGRLSAPVPLASLATARAEWRARCGALGHTGLMSTQLATIKQLYLGTYLIRKLDLNSKPKQLLVAIVRMYTVWI